MGSSPVWHWAPDHRADEDPHGEVLSAFRGGGWAPVVLYVVWSICLIRCQSSPWTIMAHIIVTDGGDVGELSPWLMLHVGSPW